MLQNKSQPKMKTIAPAITKKCFTQIKKPQMKKRKNKPCEKKDADITSKFWISRFSSLF